MCERFCVCVSNGGREGHGLQLLPALRRHKRVLTLAQRVMTLAQRVLMLAQRELGGEDPADCRPCAATDGLHRPVLLSGDRPYAAIDIAIDIVALYI